MSASRPSREKWLDDQRLIQAFARIEPRAFGISCGVVLGLGLFVATALLIVKGPVGSCPWDPPGEPLAGSHLGLLGHFLIGYGVTWTGAVIGALWGLVLGFVGGSFLAWGFNLHHRIYTRLIERGFRRRELLDG